MQKIWIASDIHGAHRHLTVDESDLLLLLGDYPNLVDYHDLSDGIFPKLTPPHIVHQVVRLMNAGRKKEARAAMKMAALSVPDLFEKVEEEVRCYYDELTASLRCKTKMIYGNADYPHLLRPLIGGDTELIEPWGAFEVDGLRIGMIAGVIPGPYSYGMPGEVKEATFNQWMSEMPPVDVLCTHGPPDIADLSYDVEAGRNEGGSKAIREYILTHRPRYHFFGHVHRGKRRVMRIGATMCINLACFRDRPFMVMVR